MFVYSWIQLYHLHFSSIVYGSCKTFSQNQSIFFVSSRYRYYGNLPMNSIISQLVKLLKLTDEPSICTMCLFCLGNILKGSFLWIDTVLDTNIISVLTSFDDVSIHLCNEN